MRRITDVRLPSPDVASSDQRHWLDLDRDGEIVDIQPMAVAETVGAGGDALASESWSGDWMSPRGIDLQINGGLGLAFPELTSDDLPRLSLIHI